MKSIFRYIAILLAVLVFAVPAFAEDDAEIIGIVSPEDLGTETVAEEIASVLDITVGDLAVMLGTGGEAELRSMTNIAVEELYRTYMEQHPPVFAYTPKRISFTSPTLKSPRTASVLSSDPVSDFTISAQGVLTAYNGDGGVVEIPSGVWSIGPMAFKDCKTITGIVFPISCSEIGTMAFAGCTGLEKVVLPQRLASLGSSAFAGCTSLVSVEAPDTLTSVGTDAFADCGAFTVTMNKNSSLAAFCAANDIPYCSLSDYTVTDGVLTQYQGIGGNIVLPETVKIIDKSVFGFNNTITRLTAPSVTETRNYALRCCTALKEVSMPSLVTIGTNTFRESGLLEKVYVPALETIGGGAFYKCSSLRSVDTLDRVSVISTYAFYGCNAFTTLEIPESVTTIESFAFAGCSGLQSVMIPGNVTAIEKKAFANCDHLTAVNITDETVSIADLAFDGGADKEFYGASLGSAAEEYCRKHGNCTFITDLYFVTDENGILLEYNGKGSGVRIPEHVNFPYSVDVTGIAADAFKGHSEITSLIIPDTVQKIDEGAFADLTRIFDLTLPTELISRYAETDSTVFMRTGIADFVQNLTMTGEGTELSAGACKALPELQTVTMSDAVSMIGDSAFAGCSALRTVKIASGLQTIGASAFAGCGMLENPQLPSGLTVIGEHAFDGCRSIRQITLLDVLKTIGDYAFAGCGSLSGISLPGSVEMVGDYAFSGCSVLAAVDFASDDTQIGAFCFQNCVLLETVSLPANLTVIKAGTFAGCSAVAVVDIPDGLLEIGDNAFRGCSSLGEIQIGMQTEVFGETIFDGYGPNFVCIVYNMSAIFDYCIENSYPYRGLDLFIVEDDALVGYRGLGGVVEIPENLGIKRITKFTWTIWQNADLTGLVIPTTVETIDERAFYQVSTLKSLVFAGAEEGTSQLKTIGNRAFYQASIESLLFPASIESIGEYCFYGMNGSLKSVDFVSTPDNPCRLTAISKSAFNYNVNLSSIFIPASVKTIGAYAFSLCTHVNELKPVFQDDELMPSQLERIEVEAFLWSHIGALRLPDSLKYLGDRVFQRSDFTELTIPGNVEHLGFRLFEQAKIQKLIFRPRITDIAEIDANLFLDAPSNIVVCVHEGDEAFAEYFTRRTGKEVIITPHIYEDGTLACSYDGCDYVRNEFGDFVVEGFTSMNDFRIDEDQKTLTICTGNPITIANKDPRTPTDWHILIDTKTDAQITLNGVSIILSDILGIYYPYNVKAPIMIHKDCMQTITLTLAEGSQNTLVAGDHFAGIHKDGLQSALIINGSGHLDAVGGDCAPGIGAVNYISGDITINGGQIIAIGGNNAAGIGSGLSVPARDIRILGGVLTVQGGGESANDIGNGYGSYGINQYDEATENIVIGPMVSLLAEKFGCAPVDEDGNKVFRSDIENPDGKRFMVNGKEFPYTDHMGDPVLYVWTKDNGNIVPTDTVTKVHSYSLSLEGKVAVNFYVFMPDILTENGAYFKLNDTVFLPENVIATNSNAPRAPEGYKTYRVSLDMVSFEMTKKVYLTVWDAESNQLPLGIGTRIVEDNRVSYCVKDWCDYMIKTEGVSERNKSLAYKLLNYGRTAQLYFEKYLDELAADESLPEMNDVTAKDVEAFRLKQENPIQGITIYSGSLLLDADTTVRVYFKLDEDAAITDYTATVDGKNAEFVLKNGLYYLQASNIAASAMYKMHIFEITNKDGETYRVSYGAFSYVYSALSMENVTERNQNIAKAVYLYGKQAEKYFNITY